MSVLLDHLKFAKAVREQAREIAEVVGAARTLSGRYVNDVLQVVRDRARAWVRGAYLTGYQDGMVDMLRALAPEFPEHGLKALNKKVQAAAAVRVAEERRAAEAEQKRLADEHEVRKTARAQSNLEEKEPPT